MTARTKIAMHPHIIFIEFVMHPWYGPAHRDAPVDDRRARVDEPQTEITRYGSTATRKEAATLVRRVGSSGTPGSPANHLPASTWRADRHPHQLRPPDERRELSIGGGVPVAKRRVRTRRRARGETWNRGRSRSAACPPSHRKAPLTVTGDT